METHADEFAEKRCDQLSLHEGMHLKSPLDLVIEDLKAECQVEDAHAKEKQAAEKAEAIRKKKADKRRRAKQNKAAKKREDANIEAARISAAAANLRGRYERTFKSYAKGHDIDLTTRTAKEVERLKAQYMEHAEDVVEQLAANAGVSVDMMLTMCEECEDEPTLDQSAEACEIRAERYLRFFHNSKAKKSLDWDSMDHDARMEVWSDFAKQMDANTLKLMRTNRMSEDAIWLRGCPTAEQQKAMAHIGGTKTKKIDAEENKENTSRNLEHTNNPVRSPPPKRQDAKSKGSSVKQDLQDRRAVMLEGCFQNHVRMYMPEVDLATADPAQIENLRAHYMPEAELAIAQMRNDGHDVEAMWDHSLRMSQSAGFTAQQTAQFAHEEAKSRPVEPYGKKTKSKRRR